MRPRPALKAQLCRLPVLSEQPLFLPLSTVRRWLGRPWEKRLQNKNLCLKGIFLIVLSSCSNPFTPQAILTGCACLFIDAAGGRRAQAAVGGLPWARAATREGRRLPPSTLLRFYLYSKRLRITMATPITRCEGFRLKPPKVRTLRAFLSSSPIFSITEITSEQMGL